MDIKKYELEGLVIWQQFIKQFSLNEQQIQQFKTYLELLCTYNDLFNLTTIVEPADIIAYHFQDSLAITISYDFKKVTMVADIGTGAGFPGIPLKILYPNLKVALIEVTKKKIEFLNTVIESLGLEGIEIWDMDFRTALRKTNEPINLFVARASLHPDELIRIFKPGCIYKNSTLVYWASKEWQIMAVEKPFFVKEETYTVQNRERRLIFFALAKVS